MMNFPSLAGNAVWIGIALAVALAVLTALTRAAGPKFKSKPLLTKNEQEFYARLRAALTADHAIFPQVALRAIVGPASAPQSRGFWRELALIGSKHCDFLIVDQASLAVVAIVELDDNSHDPKKDAARDRMTAAAGYKTLRFQSRKRPSVEELRRAILQEAPGTA